jgi:hypothetical protein
MKNKIKSIKGYDKQSKYIDDQIEFDQRFFSDKYAKY